MRWFTGISAAIAAITIAVPFALDGAWPWAAAALLLGLAWIVVPAHSYGWTSSLSLLGLTLLAGAAVLRTGMIGWALPGVLAALAAWDLCSLTERLTTTEAIRERTAYLRAHLLQLTAVLAAAWLLGLLALQITVPVGFLWALGLLLLLAVGLSVVMRAVRRTEREQL